MDQQLLVLWGKGVDNKHCKDVWVYNVRKKTWRMVSERCGVLCSLERWLVGDVGSFVPWRDG